MRIIGGHLRGRRVSTIKDPGLRPISGRIKQSLFDIIKGVVPGSRWLDLFAGTGAVGLEALSRGAESVFFVELNKRTAAALQESLVKTGLGARAKVHPGNALSDLSWVPFRSGTERFDFIFLGPPYKDEEKRALAYSNPALARVAEAGLLAPDGLILSQHHVKEEVSAPKGYTLLRREKYGDTYLDFIKREAGA